MTSVWHRIRSTQHSRMFFLACALLMVILSPSAVAFAQESSTVSAPADSGASSELVVSSPRSSPVLDFSSVEQVVDQKSSASAVDAIRQTYREQLVGYREGERQFRLVSAEHAQLQTLSSLEKVTQQWREILIQRNDVLVSYFQILHMEIESAPGLDPALRQRADEDIEAMLALLQTIAERLARSERLDEVSAIALVVESAEEDLRASAAYAQVLLKFGQLQAVYEQMHAFASLEKERQMVLPTYTSERARAFAQVESTLLAARAQLDTVRTELSLPREESHYSLVTTLSRDLQPPYSALRKVLEYFKEVTK